MSQILFWFDGQRLRKMGEIDRQAYYRGDGTVFDQDWEGFWWSKGTYKLAPDHTLRRIHKKFYRVDRKSTVRKALPLYRRRNNRQVAAILPVGHRVKIVHSDLKGWYFIKSQGGSQGWVRVEQLESHLDVIFLP